MGQITLQLANEEIKSLQEQFNTLADAYAITSEPVLLAGMIKRQASIQAIITQITNL